MFIPVSLGYIIAAKSARASVIEHAIDRPKTIGNFFFEARGVRASTGSGGGAPEPDVGRR